MSIWLELHYIFKECFNLWLIFWVKRLFWSVISVVWCFNIKDWMLHSLKTMIWPINFQSLFEFCTIWLTSNFQDQSGFFFSKHGFISHITYLAHRLQTWYQGQNVPKLVISRILFELQISYLVGLWMYNTTIDFL